VAVAAAAIIDILENYLLCALSLQPRSNLVSLTRARTLHSVTSFPVSDDDVIVAHSNQQRQHPTA